MRDLAPITQVADFEFAMAVPASQTARDLAEFVSRARAHPDLATYGTPGAGSMAHLLGILVGRQAGIDMVHVPYSGAASLVANLLGGQVPAGIGALGDFLQPHREGRLRIVATSGPVRAPLAPDIPTFREQGFPKVEGRSWLALFARAGTPAETLEAWSDAVAIALRTPSLRSKLQNLSVNPTGTSPGSLAKLVVAEREYWRPIVRAAGVKID